ncbi:PREDICTED: uncharacterized protein LOC109470543 [Branchiostoma belcheri]|uniref:Uncharacterized protein LOC109470543 n=1 Tax=Branchiostoma belcheri TaxID=7741 RepID=A0A6P4Z1W5_BRABE|nr:PREDICTED: uncharacterized protein LOC109470543 [Branchiostoma belcheri]
MESVVPNSGLITNGLSVQKGDAATKQSGINKGVKTSMLDEEIRARILAAKRRAGTTQSSRSRSAQKVFRPQGWLRPAYKNKPLNLERRGYEASRKDAVPVVDTAIQDCRYLRMYRMRRTIGMGLEEVLHDGHTNMERRLRERDDRARREREWVPTARGFHSDGSELDEGETLSEHDEMDYQEDMSDTRAWSDTSSSSILELSP